MFGNIKNASRKEYDIKRNRRQDEPELGVREERVHKNIVKNNHAKRHNKKEFVSVPDIYNYPPHDESHK